MGLGEGFNSLESSCSLVHPLHWSCSPLLISLVSTKLPSILRPKGPSLSFSASQGSQLSPIWREERGKFQALVS